MKNTYSNWLREVKKDLSFYSKHTELLAIWTILYMAVAGLFVLAIQNSILIMLSLFVLSVAITLAAAFITVHYLKKTQGNEKHLFYKTHNLFNKSFKLRNLFKLVRLPSFKHFLLYLRSEVVYKSSTFFVRNID